jgi:predicted O-linked N-acetylglucosamine transferase (SPINDLY family)
LPALREDRITFGSFNNFSKVSAEILDVWSTILRDLPRSRLMLKSQALTSRTARSRVIDIFEKEGVSADRIEFMSFEPSVRMHLDFYNRIDIADTPLSGQLRLRGSLDGVLVITLAGNACVTPASACYRMQDWNRIKTSQGYVEQL